MGFWEKYVEKPIRETVEFTKDVTHEVVEFTKDVAHETVEFVEKLPERTWDFITDPVGTSKHIWETNKGAIIGGVTGFAFFGPWGIIPGAIAGHYVEEKWNTWFDVPETPPIEHPSYRFEGPYTAEGLSVPVPVVYGRVKLGGALIYAGGLDDVYDFFVALSEGTIQSVTDVRVNDVPLDQVEGAEYTVYYGDGTQTADSRFKKTYHSELASPLTVWDRATHGENPNPLPYVQTTFTVLEDNARVLLTFKGGLPWGPSDNDRILKFRVECKLSTDPTWSSIDCALLVTGNKNGTYDFTIPLPVGSGSTNSYKLHFKTEDRIITGWAPPAWTGDTANVRYRLWPGGQRKESFFYVQAGVFPAGTYDLRVTFLWVKYNGSEERVSGSLALTRIIVEERNEPQTFRHTAYIAATIPSSELVRGRPKFTAIVEGINTIKYWDAVTSTWVTGYTNNPIWCLRDFLTNARYGVGIPETFIDDESFKTAAAYCDELVNGEPRFTFNYVFMRQQDPMSAVRTILSHCRGLWWIDEGKIKVRIEKPALPTARQIDVGDVVDGTMEYWHESAENIPDAMVARYVDASEGYEQRSIVVGDVRRGGRVDTREWFGSTSLAQTKRLAYHLLNRAKLTARIRFATPLSTLALEPGDVVEVFHPVGPFGYDISNPDAPVKLASGSKFLIIGIQDQPNDTRVYLCRPYDEAIYSDSPSILDPMPVTTPLLSSPFEVPEPVEDLQVSVTLRESADGIWRPYVVAEWTHPKPLVVGGYSVYMNRYGTTLNSGAWEFITFAKDPVASWELPADWTGTLAVSVIPESKTGVRGSAAAAPIATATVVADTTPPAVPSGLSASFANTVVWTWAAPTDADFSHFEISLDGGVTWTRVDANRYEIPKPTQRSYTLHVRAVDRTGNASASASATATLTAPGAPSTTYLMYSVRDNVCQVWVASGFTESPGHVGYVFEWQKAGDASWTAVQGQTATIVVPLSDFGSSDTLNINVRYAEVDVVGQGSMSSTVVVTLSKPSYNDLVSVPPQEISLWVPPDGELFEFRENLLGSKGTNPL